MRALYLIVIILFSVIALEFLARQKFLNKELSRKLLHIIAGSAVANVFLAGYDYYLLAGIAIAASLILFLSVKYRWLKQLDEHERKSWGIFYFALSFLVLILLWYPDYPEVASAAFLVLAFADSLAAIAGTFLASHYYHITRDKKSLLGSIVFFGASFAVIFLFHGILPDFRIKLSQTGTDPLLYLLVTALILSAILTLVEAISSGGIDNLMISVTGSFFIFYIYMDPGSSKLLALSAGFGLALAVGTASYKLRFLSLSGTTGAVILGTVVFTLGGWKYTLPIMTFFVLSSILSKISKKMRGEQSNGKESGDIRNHKQLLANGGIAGVLTLLSVIFKDDLIYFLYVASLCAAAADTWSTETGTMKKRKTYSFPGFREVEQGVSGGVSLAGSFGGMLGAFSVALSAMVFVTDYKIIILLVAAGIAGAFSDSLLGDKLQRRNRCRVCGKITEKENHCSEPSEYHSGIRFLDNDVVNFAAGLAAVTVFLIIYSIGL